MVSGSMWIGEASPPAIISSPFPRHRIHVVENSFHRDAYLLKALATNGVCAEWCPTSPAFPLPKPFGVNYVGATFAFTYSDINANPHFRTASQLMQSSYLALQAGVVARGNVLSVAGGGMLATLCEINCHPHLHPPLSRFYCFVGRCRTSWSASGGPPTTLTSFTSGSTATRQRATPTSTSA